MRTLAALFFTALLGLVSSNGYAHDANFAAIKIIRQPSNSWLFELKTPLHELDKSMRRFHEERLQDLTELSTDTTRYKELIVEYVKATFAHDNRAVDDDDSRHLPSSPLLGSGRIRLGNHESVLRFTIENMPAALDELTLRLPYMATNAGQHNILWLIDGQRSQRHILSEKNDFTVIATDFFE